MPTMIVRHRVKDFDAWRSIYEEHGAARRQYGITDVSLHRDVEDPNDVVIVFRVDDLGRAQEFAATEDLRETMERAGVVSEPTVWFLQDA